MKKPYQWMIPALCGSWLIPNALQSEVIENRAFADAKVEVHASGNGAQSESKSVSVVSENGRTVRKTTVTRNGKTETTTETLDADGNVIGGGADDAVESEDVKSSDDESSAASGEGEAWIGLRVKEADETLRSQLDLKEGQGAVIDAVAPNGPADDASVAMSDLLLQLNGLDVANADDLRAALDSCEPGQQVTAKILRRGQLQDVKVLLEEAPAGNSGTARRDSDESESSNANGKMMDELGSLLPEDIAKRIKQNLGENSRVEVHISSDGIESLDEVLNSPGLPEEFKDSVRDIQERMRQFEKKE